MLNNWHKLKIIQQSEYTNINCKSQIINTLTSIIDDFIAFFKTQEIEIFNNHEKHKYNTVKKLAQSKIEE